MDLSWTVDRTDDVSLVRCRIHNDAAVPQRVRIESRIDAPVLPPRRGGVPEAGWDAAGVTLRLGADERRGVGFAVPAPPVEPPVAIVGVEQDQHAESDQPRHGPPSAATDEQRDGATATEALRALADHRPPRSAVHGGLDAADVDGGDRARNESRDRTVGGEEGEDGSGHRRRESDCDEQRRAVPSAVDEWFDAVEARIDRAEQLTGGDVETATAVVADAGGVDAVTDLDESVAADVERLRRLRDRAAALAERGAAADVPVGALERLA